MPNEEFSSSILIGRLKREPVADDIPRYWDWSTLDIPSGEDDKVNRIGTWNQGTHWKET